MHQGEDMMAELVDSATESKGRPGRRGLLAAVALAAAALATKGAQPAAAQDNDNKFFASGGDGPGGIAFQNTGTGYAYGGSLTGDYAGLIGYCHMQYSGVIGVADASNGFAGVSGITTAGNGYGVYGRSPNGNSLAGVYGENVYNSTSIGVQGYTGTAGIGVLGGNTNGTGVFGTSTGGYGVFGSANNIGVRGQGNGGSAIGVAGYNNTATQPAIHGENSDGYGIGVRGKGGGYGLWGEGINGVIGKSNVNGAGIGVSGEIPSTAVGATAVSGYNPGTDANNTGTAGYAKAGTGVYGTSATGIGVRGVNTGGGASPFGVVGQVKTAPGFALYGIASVAGTVGFAGGASVAGAIAGQFTGNVNFYGGGSAGNTVTLNGTNLVVANGGTKNAAVQVADGSYRLLHCVEAPEPWFEDFGEGTINGGKATVTLDPLFASTIDTSTLHAFFVSHDANHALHLGGKSTTGFTVEAQPSAVALAAGKRQGDLGGTFTWRVVGKRKDVSGERLAKFTLPKEIKLAPPPDSTTLPESALSHTKPVTAHAQAQSVYPDLSAPVTPRNPGLPPSLANPMTKG